MNNRILSSIAVILAMIGLAACDGVNHDAANPTEDIQTRWVRMETPPSFTTLMFTCFGPTGIYMDQNDGNANEVPNDPLCPITNVFLPEIQKRYGFKLVLRTNGRGAGNS